MAERTRKDDFHYRFRKAGLSSVAVQELWKELQRLREEVGLPSEEPVAADAEALAE